TIMGRLGQPVRHQCWGRDLLGLPPGDEGWGVIKPSGGDQTVAMLSGSQILIQPKNGKAELYEYRLGARPAAEKIMDSAHSAALGRQLTAYIHTATQSLLLNTAGLQNE